MNNIKVINPEAFLKAVHSCNNGQFGQLSYNDFEIKFEDVQPLKGYEKPINEKTGEVFPNCCEWHKNAYNSVKKWFTIFPNCCTEHKKLIGQSWFNKSDYNDVIDKILNQLSYTEHCIIENINKNDWYDAITDYINWNYYSFGQLPNGYGSPVGLSSYLNLLKYSINARKEIPKEKRQKLIEFINAYYKPVKKKQTDINILLSTYQKWLKIFPFEISFFSELKPHFEKQLPILTGKPKVNRYTGIAIAKVHTKSSLIDSLLNLTNDLLTQINTATLYKKGLLTEPNKIKLELVLNERKTKLKQGYVNSSKDEEQRYRKILKEWFADEKKFIDEVTPLLKGLPPKQSEKQKSELKLKDFFIKEVSSDTIAAIQTEFAELEGKDLAILIYLLHKEYKIIEILTNSRTKGRKGFVKCLKETDNPTMQKVNKCFVPNTDDLIYSTDDLVFQSLNKRLTEIIKK